MLVLPINTETKKITSYQNYITASSKCQRFDRFMITTLGVVIRERWRASLPVPSQSRVRYLLTVPEKFLSVDLLSPDVHLLYSPAENRLGPSMSVPAVHISTCVSCIYCLFSWSRKQSQWYYFTFADSCCLEINLGWNLACTSCFQIGRKGRNWVLTATMMSQW
jgi:hypothetical protein